MARDMIIGLDFGETSFIIDSSVGEYSHNYLLQT